jgi:hypothetical protein
MFRLVMMPPNVAVQLFHSFGLKKQTGHIKDITFESPSSSLANFMVYFERTS